VSVSAQLSLDNYSKRGTLRYFASGTGAAGLVGAFLWWELRGLGVRTGVGLSSVRRSVYYARFVA
jgi:hypothetical protein